MKAAAYKGSDYLKTQKDVVAYLNAALEDGEPAVLLEALRNVAMAKGGIAGLARAAGVSRESLYRTLSRRGNPKLETIMELLRALGLKLTVERGQHERCSRRGTQTPIRPPCARWPSRCPVATPRSSTTTGRADRR